MIWFLWWGIINLFTCIFILSNDNLNNKFNLLFAEIYRGFSIILMPVLGFVVIFILLYVLYTNKKEKQK